MERRVGGLDFGRFELNFDGDQCQTYDKFLELQLRGGYKRTQTQGARGPALGLTLYDDLSMQSKRIQEVQNLGLAQQAPNNVDVLDS
eukprot:2119594-Ditylum_brightwellii.AAC.1